MSHEQLIRLQYLDNITRKTIAEVDISQFESRTIAAEYLLKLLQDNGFACATDRSKLYLLGSDLGFDTAFEKCDSIPDHAVVYYSAVVLPNSAAEFGRENGIVYVFRSSERPHLEMPHIHAMYSGEEICIYFKDLRTNGKFKNTKKEKEAIEYVKNNICDLLDEWNRIHGALS